MLEIKFTHNNSMSEYNYKKFETYDELGRWYAHNYPEITVWEITRGWINKKGLDV